MISVIRTVLAFLLIIGVGDVGLALDRVRVETSVDKAVAALGVSGAGVIVAILDRGIDWESNDFRNEDGSTRIAYIFDLFDDSAAAAPGNSYGRGTIYTREQIDQALFSGTRLPTRDAVGHGTTTTGIAAGNGRNSADGKYRGIAPNATIISVKIATGAPAHGNEPAEPPWYVGTAGVNVAMDFVVDKARELSMPVVMLLNVGSIGGPTDGTSAFCRRIDETVGPDHPGIVFVNGTGDDGTPAKPPRRAAGDVPNGGTLDLRLALDTGEGVLEVWYEQSQEFAVSIHTPMGMLGPFPASQFTAKGTGVNVYHYRGGTDHWGSTNGNRLQLIHFDGAAGPGDYLLRLDHTASSAGSSIHFDASLNAANFSGRFLNFVTPGSISDGATAFRNVAPNSYVIRTKWKDIDGVDRGLIGEGNVGELWTGSSVGPTVDGRVGVDVSAPGDRIVTTYAPRSAWGVSRWLLIEGGGGLYGMAGAVSAAAPIVTGIIALMLEVDPTLDALSVKKILQETARADEFTGPTPNPLWGYGKVDAFEALMAVRLQAQDDTAPAGTESFSFLYFPDYVDGGGWSVQLVLSNVDPEAAAEVQVDVYDPDGQPVLDLFDSDLTLEIPSLGSRVLKSAGSGTIRRGWIQIETGTAAVSGLLTYRDTQSGIEVGVKPVELGSQFALFVEETPSVGAGVAVYKTDAAARVELRIRDEEGHDPLEGGVVRWENFHQRAGTLPEWFAGEGVDTEFLRDFRGLLFLETEDESPFAPLGLRFGKGTSSLSAVPAIRTQSQEPQEAALVFPDYVDGGGWSVQLVLSNVDPEEAAAVRVEVYDPDGQPVLDLFDSDLTLEIPSLGSRVLRSAGSGAIRRGWIQVQTGAAAVSGLLTYRDVQSGVEVGVEPVQLGHEFALFVEESGTIGAGLALFKPDASSRIELRLRDEEGNDPLEGVFLPWRDFNQEARTLPEWFDVPGVDTGFLADFRGLLFLRTENESPFAPLGLRFGKGTSSLSAVPAIRIAEGGGIDGGHPPPPTVTLSASPKSIDRGQSTTLSWSSTSAESAEIEPDIGEVPTSGTRRVSPNATTTYRITVTGADGQTATASVTVTVAVSERAALRALFDALGGSGWSHSNNWLTDTPLGDWYGVEVDSQGRVIELRMAVWVDTEDGGSEKLGNGLTGVIPPELGSLPHLRVLDLSHNQLEGPIPAQLGSLSSLQVLDLGGNQLTGPIPPELGSLSNLQRLSLWGNQLTGPIPPDLGRLADLESLDVFGNDLTGPIPPELGQLASLTRLQLGSNSLTGTIPRSLLDLTRLTRFYFERNEDLCAPGVAAFADWLGAMEDTSGPYCNESDVEALELLFETAGGTGWTRADGWRATHVLGEWHGVTADALGRVEALDLRGNGLAGEMPNWPRGALANMTDLRISANAGLAGRLPLSLADLSLRVLDYAGTELCAPADAAFTRWLNTVSSHQGTGVECAPLSDREILESFYEATGGPNWYHNDNWLTDAPLGDWYGVEVDGQDRVTELEIQLNRLTGQLPPELGSLANLRSLFIWLDGTTGPIPPELGNLANLRSLRLMSFADTPHLTGPIPPELGNLANLQVLELWNNDLTGPIPPELGDLARLRHLGLDQNRLTGPIPTELGRLANLNSLHLSKNDLTGPIPTGLGGLANMRSLNLASNRLSGPIPTELGGLANVESVYLGDNELTGPVPAVLGGLIHLRHLALQANPGMSGALPASLTNLASLETLQTGGTDLCAPSDAGFLDWLERVANRQVALCGHEPAMAYLVQAVQSREFPVPLVAGREALLRVFVTAGRDNDERLPPVRASFYLNGALAHVAEIAGGPGPIPTQVDEGSLATSANAAVPAELVQPGLEMVVEIDPDGTLESGLGVARRIPNTGRAAVDVRAVPLLDLTLVPFLWAADPDSTILEPVVEMAADPEGHELLEFMRTVLPVGDLDVKAHEPVLSSTNDGFELVEQVRAIR